MLTQTLTAQAQLMQLNYTPANAEPVELAALLEIISAQVQR